jgi:hypothetical protein
MAIIYSLGREPYIVILLRREPHLGNVSLPFFGVGLEGKEVKVVVG